MSSGTLCIASQMPDPGTSPDDGSEPLRNIRITRSISALLCFALIGIVLASWRDSTQYRSSMLAYSPLGWVGGIHHSCRIEIVVSDAVPLWSDGKAFHFFGDRFASLAPLELGRASGWRSEGRQPTAFRASIPHWLLMLMVAGNCGCLLLITEVRVKRILFLSRIRIL